MDGRNCEWKKVSVSGSGVLMLKNALKFSFEIVTREQG